MKTSDTPRTEVYVLDPLPQVVSADWARQLERELAAAKERIRRLEEAGDALQSAVVGTEGMTHWQWLAAAHEADLRWRKAKEAKP